VKKKLDGKYVMLSYARSFLPGMGAVAFTAYLDEDKEWVFLFDGRKRIWDCNQTFFEHHFRKVRQ
jgi:hypothetical protein